MLIQNSKTEAQTEAKIEAAGHSESPAYILVNIWWNMMNGVVLYYFSVRVYLLFF